MTLEAYKLGDVANVDWGNTSITKSSYTEEGYPAFSAAGQDGFMPIYEHEGDAVVVSAIGARCGKCFWAFGKWIAIKNTIIVKSKDEDICNTAYLYFLLNDEKFWPRSGSGQPFIAIGKAKLLDIHLPNIHTQRKIVDVLWSIQAAKGTREAELALERERKAALMAYLFTHGTRGEALKQTEIGEMPKSWNVSLLKNCADKPEYGYTESANNDPVGPKFLRITDIQDGYVDWNNVPYCVCDERTFAKKKLIKDDLVIARIGATTGKAFYISDCPDQAVYASYLIRVRAQKNVMHPKYFAHFAETPLYWDHINKNKGGKLKGGVNIPILQAMKLPLGSLEEQKEIVDILDAQEKKIRALIQEMKVLNELFHSLLDELMSGKLSVEPLLEPKKAVKKKVAA